MGTAKLVKKANSVYERQNWEEALPYYMELWNRQPENKDFLVIVAFLLSKLGVRAPAIAVLEQALEVHGPTKDVLKVLGDMASSMSMPDIAFKVHQIYVSEFPDDPEGYVNLAASLGELHRREESIEILQAVIPQFPEDSRLWNVLASHVAIHIGISASLQFFEEALRLDPNNFMALNNLSNYVAAIGQFERAIEYGERAHKIQPDHHEPVLGLALTNMRLGNLEEGFEQYEIRYHPRRPSSILFAEIPPTWEGEDLSGKSILIANEQGLGDEFLFAMNFHLIQEQADKVYIGCDARLIPLLERSFPGATAVMSGTTKTEGYNIRGYPDIIKAKQAGEFEVDYSIKAGSIPRHFWKKTSDIKCPEDGWLTPDPERVKYWKAELDKLGDKPKVGIVWRSGLRSAVRDIGYTQLEDWENVLKNDKVTMVCLQYDDCSEELEKARKDYGVDIYVPEGLDQKNNIDDTCALLKALDLVIGPSTTPAMMANAVGTPVWWLLRGIPWWFFGETDKTPISPKGEVFLASLEEPWDVLFENVCDRLEAYAQD